MSVSWSEVLHQSPPADGDGFRFNVLGRDRRGRTDELRRVPDALVGFARAELRDRLGPGVEFVTRRTP